MKLKKLLIILLIITFIIPLTGCYDAVGLESLGYVVAIGLDVGENDTLKLSLQFAILNNSNNSDSSSSDKSTVTTVDCSTIDAGISLINSYISKKVNLSHCKAIIISEELAEKGISEHVFTLVNNIQIRPECNIIISRCDASDFLNNSIPTLESFSARYYEFILNSSEYTGYSGDIYLSDFYSDILSTTCESVAILGGINNETSHQAPTANFEDLNGNYKADETPIKNSTNIETMGLAIFKGDKLIGELNNIETLCHLIITNKLENATITVPSPYDYNSAISLYIGIDKNTKKTVKFINGTPYIECKIYITANALSMNDDLDYSDSNTLKTIENYLNTYLEENISSYLYKTAKEYKVDIADFGRYALKNYWTWNDWIASDWLSNYENAFFSVDVNSTIQSGYLYTKI